MINPSRSDMQQSPVWNSLNEVVKIVILIDYKPHGYFLALDKEDCTKSEKGKRR